MVRFKHNVNFKVGDEELREIERMAEEWDCSRSEVWRRLLYTIRVLYSSDLMLSDVLQVNDETKEIHKLLAQGHDMPLYEAMRPVPELDRILKAKAVMDELEKSKGRVSEES